MYHWECEKHNGIFSLPCTYAKRKTKLINWKSLVLTLSIVSVVHMFLLYGLFMNPLSKEIIFSHALGQSSKLVAVWTQISPVPSITSLAAALLIPPILYTINFVILYDSIPGRNSIRKGFSFGIILWSTVAICFELFTPYGLFGEPLYLVAYELMLWFIGLSTVGLVMGLLYRKDIGVLLRT